MTISIFESNIVVALVTVAIGREVGLSLGTPAIHANSIFPLRDLDSGRVESNRKTS